MAEEYLRYLVHRFYYRKLNTEKRKGSGYERLHARRITYKNGKKLRLNLHIVYNFLEKHNFDGKTIYPFCTHEGSGEAGTFYKVEDAAPGATVADGFELAGHATRTERGIKKLQDWLESNN